MEAWQAGRLMGKCLFLSVSVARESRPNSQAVSVMVKSICSGLNDYNNQKCILFVTGKQTASFSGYIVKSLEL